MVSVRLILSLSFFSDVFYPRSTLSKVLLLLQKLVVNLHPVKGTRNMSNTSYTTDQNKPNSATTQGWGAYWLIDGILGSLYDLSLSYGILFLYRRVFLAPTNTAIFIFSPFSDLGNDFFLWFTQMADIEERIERMEAVIGKNPEKLVSKL